jgi:hypothetical protein
LLASPLHGCAYDLLLNEETEPARVGPDVGEEPVDAAVFDDAESVEPDAPSRALKEGSGHRAATGFPEGDDAGPGPNEEPTRVTDGLLALYSFDDVRDGVVPDHAGTGDLSVTQGELVPLFYQGAAVDEASIVVREDAASWVDAFVQAEAFTFEVWLRPNNNTQGGPARIVGIEGDPWNRNLMIGQEGSSLVVRVRLGEDSSPSDIVVEDVFASAGGVHLAVVYGRALGLLVYVDGQAVVLLDPDEGATLVHWDRDYPLAIANLAQGERAWLGELYLAAWYDRALSASEVRINLDLGPQL